MNGGFAMLFLMGLAVGGFVYIARHAGKPHTLIEIAGGAAELRRGTLPPGLLSDLADVARGAPEAEGQVEIRGERDTLQITTLGLDPHLAQRVRNVLLLARSRIRRTR